MFSPRNIGLASPYVHVPSAPWENNTFILVKPGFHIAVTAGGSRRHRCLRYAAGKVFPYSIGNHAGSYEFQILRFWHVNLKCLLP